MQAVQAGFRLSNGTIFVATAIAGEWTYTMSDDSPMKVYWEALKTTGTEPYYFAVAQLATEIPAEAGLRPTYIQDTITSQFKFKATVGLDFKLPFC